MSADNWTNCPRCMDLNAKEITAMEERLRDSYGKIPVDEYETMREAVVEAQYNRDANNAYSKYATFREDYEFYGAENGTLEISYSGQCTKCGLKLQFREEKEFYK